jgi:nucleoid-associated protein YgaU
VDLEDAVDAAAAARVARSRRGDGRGALSDSSRFRFGRSRPVTAGQARPLPERAADPAAPAWERPRRFDSYPAIKSPRGPIGLPRVAVWAGLLLAAALVLFFVPPLFLGGGGGGAGATPTPSASADASVAPSPTATVAPAPTPFTYTVKAGDTLSRIAGKYKVAVADILAVNPEMTNPDRLQIGQQIVIPLPVSSIIPDAGTPTASTAP